MISRTKTSQGDGNSRSIYRVFGEAVGILLPVANCETPLPCGKLLKPRHFDLRLEGPLLYW